MSAQRTPRLHLVAPAMPSVDLRACSAPTPRPAGLSVPGEHPILLVAGERQRYAWLTGEVHAAPDSLEALANAITNEYAAMFIEVSLKDGRESGHELVHQLRAHHRVRCPIFLVSDFDPLPSDRSGAHQVGATDLIRRDSGAVVGALRQVLDGASHAAPQGHRHFVPAHQSHQAAQPGVSQPSWLPAAVELAREFLAFAASRHVQAIYGALAQRQHVVEWAHVVAEVAELIDDLEDRCVFLRLANGAWVSAAARAPQVH